MSLFAGANNGEASTPSPSLKKRPRAESQKLKQVLNYSSSVDKVSELLGVEPPKVYEIYKEQAEDEIEQKRRVTNPLNKRNSQKALSLLGHDPSTEKVKKTLGIDEEEVHDVYMQNAMNKPRRVETSMNKKKYAKALTTLGFNLSLYKATQLLGVDEEVLRAVFRYHSEMALQEEHRVWKRALESKALRDKKRNRKALHVIGYDPSLEKVLSMLGVDEGTQEEADVGKHLPVGNRQRVASPFSPFPQATALVYALSAAILITSLRHNL